MKRNPFYSGENFNSGGTGFFTSARHPCSGVAFAIYLLWPVPWCEIISCLLLGDMGSGWFTEKKLSKRSLKKWLLTEVVGRGSQCTVFSPGFLVPALFSFFEIIDIIKPIPVSTVEKLPGGLGIVADEL